LRKCFFNDVTPLAFDVTVSLHLFVSSSNVVLQSFRSFVSVLDGMDAFCIFHVCCAPCSEV